MKSFFKSMLLMALVLLSFSCSSDDDTIIPTLNTSEYFKYSINNGPDRIFDAYARGWYEPNPNSTFEKFYFRAGAATADGSTVIVDADFTFQDFTSFTNTTNFNWGVSDGLTANFYFTELTPGHTFLTSWTVMPSNPVVCTITVHPVNVGDYIEFSFQGDYLLATDNSIQGSIIGEGRVLRE
ncbi:hypothetical protein [Winogradskyella costae]|uniref:hypothetical protein n=1 Tax=Winogradskyella costae TaxID=2697008 RepID=UPI0015CCBC97|nr:hypothetical protein [Winogradskyella costae]